MALCNLIRHDKPLPREYQNFDTIAHVPHGEEEYYGGSVSLADHCPYIQEFTWRNKNIVIRGSQCQFIDNNPSKLKFGNGLLAIGIHIQINNKLFYYQFQKLKKTLL